MRAHIEDEMRPLPLAEVARRLAELAVVVEYAAPDAAEQGACIRNGRFFYNGP